MREVLAPLRVLPLSLAALSASCGLPDPNAVAQCRPPGRSGCPSPVNEEFRDPVRHLGRADSSTFIEITDLVADYPRVFGCTGVRGMVAWDASKSDPPMLVQNVGPSIGNPQYPRCVHLGFDPTTNRIAITNRGDEIQPEPWLWIYDVSDANSPREIGGAITRWSVEGVVFEGDLLYVTGHTSGVHVLAVEGEGLVERGVFADEASDAWTPVKVGTTLFVAEGATGLRTYDVSTDTPALLATVALEGSSRDLVVVDGVAYLATSHGVATVDVRDPAAPVVLQERATDGTTLAIEWAGANTIVTAEWDEMRGYNVADPANVTQAFAERVPSDRSLSRVLAVTAAPDQARLFAGEWRGMHEFELLGSGTGPDIQITPSSVQFGDVGPGESETRVVVVRNSGDQPLTVHDVVSAAGVSADNDCFQIEPGTGASLEIEIRPETDSEIRSSLRVCSDDPDERDQDVSLSANVEGLGIGDRLPSFSLQDLDGLTWTEHDLQGKVAVLAYFATF